jgi:hypothetical protein
MIKCVISKVVQVSFMQIHAGPYPTEANPFASFVVNTLMSPLSSNGKKRFKTGEEGRY